MYTLSISASPIESRYHVKKYLDESDFCNMKLAKENAYSILIKCSSIFRATSVFKSCHRIGFNTLQSFVNVLCILYLFLMSLINMLTVLKSNSL